MSDENSAPPLPENWQEKDHYMFGATWCSKRNERRDLAERFAIEQASQGKAVSPLLAALELKSSSYRERFEGWHYLFSIETFRSFDGFKGMTDGVKSFLKRHDLSAGMWEMMYDDAPPPVRLSKSQRISLIDTFIKGAKAHDFAEDEMFRLLQPFGDYALTLHVEHVRFREGFDTTFGAEDNPLKSLIGLSCTVRAWTFAMQEDEENDDELPLLGQGVLELDGGRVRVGDWQHRFEADDKIIESIAYEEVNVRSETLEMNVLFDVLDKKSEVEDE